MKKSSLFALVLLLGLAGFSVINGFAEEGSEQGGDKPLVVSYFTPNGETGLFKVVRVTFSEPMVALGDGKFESNLPFEINCPRKGTPGWSPPNVWTYEFTQSIEPGDQCSFKVKPGLKALSGKSMTGQQEFSFHVGGPSIEGIIPYEGQKIREDQAFILTPTVELVETSFLQSSYIEVDGISERIELELIQGAMRDQILDTDYNLKRRKRQKRVSPERSRTLVFKAKRALPPSRTVRVVLGKGTQGKNSKGVSSVVQESTWRVYETRDEFRAHVSCERENPKSPCIPFMGVSVQFNAPVLWKNVKNAEVRLGEKVWRPELPRQKSKKEENLDNEEVQYLSFKGPFPEDAHLKVTLGPMPSAPVIDEAGRELTNADKFPLELVTGRFPALAKFAANFGIVEWKGGALLPVTLRNIEPNVLGKLGDLKNGSSIFRMFSKPGNRIPGIRKWLAVISDRESRWDSREKSIFQENEASSLSFERLDIPKRSDSQFFDVVGVPLKKPGFYVVEVESQILGQSLLGKPAPMYVAAAAQVTDLAIHLKLGRDSSLAWVTSLETGAPVASADVELVDCEGKSLAKGRTNADGWWIVNQHIEEAKCENKKKESYQYDQYARGVFAVAEKGDDWSFSHSSWEQGIERWRFKQMPSTWEGNALIAHTIMSRTLLRAGETAHFRHLLRRRSVQGVEFPRASDLPKTLKITHESGQDFQFPLSWDDQGNATGQWEIPKDAKLGTYTLEFVGFQSSQRESGLASAGSFRVEEFKIPIAKGTIQGPKGSLIASQNIPIDVAVSYLNGGSASRLPVLVRYSQPKPKTVTFSGNPFFNEVNFANGRYEESSRYSEDDEEPVVRESSKVWTKQQNLDGSGAAKVNLDRLKSVGRASEVEVELEYRDPNGLFQATSTAFTVYPSKKLVGLKVDRWSSSKDGLKIEMAASSPEGKPLSGEKVRLKVIERRTDSHRKRLVGGFYAYESRQVKKDHGFVCPGLTDEHGKFKCIYKPDFSGQVILEAEVLEKGSTKPSSVASASAYYYGGRETWEDQEDHDRLDLIPEKAKYEPGETAKLQINMPYREAEVLITIEREGVMEAFVKKVTATNPVLEVPIKQDYTPNIVVGAMIVRGRVGEVQPTATVDLGKPSFKIGMVGLDIGWGAHELKVEVTPEKKIYRVREKVKAKVQVTGVAKKSGSLFGKAPSAEVAVAVVDEGLLQLEGNLSWKILPEMMRQHSHLVNTSTLQGLVIGKRHFGAKAKAQPGDGGGARRRELFETLLYWNPRLKLDAEGKAQFEFDLKDSLTKFRVVAVALNGPDQFGYGDSNFKVVQDLTIYPSLASIVREGDQIDSEFTIRNSSDQNLVVDVKGKILNAPVSVPALELKAGGSEVVHFPVKVPSGITKIAYEIDAVGHPKDSTSVSFTDHVGVKQNVLEAVSVRTLDATLDQVVPGYSLAVKRPADAISNLESPQGRGGIRVTLDKSLASGLTEVRSWMEHYLYGCLEQKASKAMTLGDRSLWDGLMKDLPTLIAPTGLAKYYPVDQLDGSVVLTTYLLTASAEKGWEIPSSSRGRLIDGLRNFVRGSNHKTANSWMGGLETQYMEGLKIGALAALARYEKLDVKDIAALTTLQLMPNTWRTGQILDWVELLERAEGIPKRDARLAEAWSILQSRVQFSGTKMRFIQESAVPKASDGSGFVTDFVPWLMTDYDSSAARLVTTILNHKKWPNWKSDVPKLVRGLLARQQGGRWSLTTSNAWGAIAVDRFAAEFESSPVSGKTVARLGDQSATHNWSEKLAPLNLPWSAKPEASLALTQEGSGKPWALIETRAAIPITGPVFKGFRITKKITPVERKSPDHWSQGDIYKVHLDIQNDGGNATWVVISDPLPAGASHLGVGLGGESRLAQRQTSPTSNNSWIFPIYVERAFDALRSYYEWVPSGIFSYEYTVRLNAKGMFVLPSTRVEAMYDPGDYAEIPNADFEVK